MAFMVKLLCALFAVFSCPAWADAVYSAQDQGQWKVQSVHVDDYSAVTNADAQKFVGTKVEIAQTQVQFGTTSCKVDRKKIGESDEFPNFPMRVHYHCANDVDVPAFFVGSDHNRLMAALDGITYMLLRQNGSSN
jgi:hypothetical protein